MTRVLAMIDHSPSARAVRHTAGLLADLLGAELIPITALNPDGRPSTEPQDDLLRQLAADDVVFGVLGTRALAAKPEPLGHVAAGILARSPVPLVLVPPDDGAFKAGRLRLLLPLDGSSETDAALLPLANRLNDAGADLVVLHVYDSQTVPPFIQSSDDVETLATEFSIRHAPGLGTNCELRIGDPGRVILDRAAADDIDGVILAWGQDLSPGRAEVIRRLLREIHVPLLIVPIARREV